MRLSALQTKAVIAVLLDRFRLSIAQIARLTDRQILQLYWHRRDREGSIVFPENDEGKPDTGLPDQPLTLEEELVQLDKIAHVFKMPASAVEACRVKLRAKFAAAATGE